MRFSLSHRRALIGHDVTVKVTAAAKEAIARVTTELDGRTIKVNVAQERSREGGGRGGGGNRGGGGGRDRDRW